MGKIEFDNIRKLLKIRMRDCKGLSLLSSLLFIAFLTDTANLIQTVFTDQKDATLYSASVYPTIGLFLMLIACVYYTFQSGEYNDQHRMYPHSSSTQFISFELYCYLTHIFLQVLALGLYLLQYLICYIINQMKGNFVLAYEMNAGFIISGFFVYLLYGFILMSLIIIISNIVRKFRWWALLVYIILFLLFMYFGYQSTAESVICFYTEETSLLLFFLKAVVTWILLELLNHILMSNSRLSGEGRFFYRHLIISIVILFSFLINILSNITSSDNRQTFDNYLSDNYSFTDENAAYSYDISTPLPNGIVHVSFDIDPDSRYTLSYGDTVYNTTKNELLIHYLPRREYKDWINLTEFTHEKFIANLSGDKLTIRIIQVDNVKVISLYPYAIMQFSCFKDKPYAKKFAGSMSGDLYGTIQISTPQDKQITVE